MAGTAQAAELIHCERCSGHYVVDASGDGKPRVRCNKCGHQREPAEPSPASIPGKWTVIGPDGKAMSFDTWEELTESRRPSAIQTATGVAHYANETKDIPKDKRSASALLDITPEPQKVPEKAKLALADMDSALDMGEIGGKKRPSSLSSTLTSTLSSAPGSAKSGEKLEPLLVRSFSQAPNTQHSPKVEWAPRIDKPAGSKSEAPRVEDATLRVELAPAPLTARVMEADRPTAPNVNAEPDSLDELDPDSLIEETDDDEPAPLSLRDAIQDSSGDLLGDDDLEEDNEPPEPHDLLSLRDLVVVPAVAPNEGKITSHAPAKSQAPKAMRTEPKVVVAASQPPPPTRPKSLSRPDVTTVRPPPVSKAEGSADDTKRRAVAHASSGEEPSKRGWILGALALLVVGGVAWRLLSGDPKPTPRPNPTPTVATTAPVTPVTTPAVVPPPPPSSTEEPISVDTPPTAAPPSTSLVPPATRTTVTPSVNLNPNPNPNPNPTPPTTVATGEKPVTPPKPTVANTDSPGSLSDLLDKAGAARRKGDFATARDLYQRVVAMSPGNVEANGGLGDVARAQGDLAAAKVSYERALAASPTYTPAQLGLADVEWDQGNRPSATKRYAAVVDRMGDRAPQRAKERSSAGN